VGRVDESEGDVLPQRGRQRKDEVRLVPKVWINGIDDGAAARVPVVPEAGRGRERGEGSGVFDELEGQRTGRLEVRPTLFLGNAPEVIRRGKIDAKIQREAPRIRPFVLRFGFRLLGADPWRRPDGNHAGDKAHCKPSTPNASHSHQKT